MDSYSVQKKILLFLLTTGILAQGFPRRILNSNPCQAATTCSQCITAHPKCAWCALEGYTLGSKPRCDLFDNINKTECTGQIQYPRNYLIILKSLGLTANGKRTENIVQLQPQEVKLKLRPKEKDVISGNYRLSEDKQQITSGVSLEHNAPMDVGVNFFSKCSGSSFHPSSACKGLNIGQSVQFIAEFELNSCPENREEWTTSIDISLAGTNETIVVHLEMLCGCDCEKERELASPKCTGSGSYQCGYCQCSENNYGRFCECRRPTSVSQYEASACQSTNTSLVCSGRGSCTCGRCSCFKRKNPEEHVIGEFCECDNFTCDRYMGLLCGGPQQGECVCGKCMCTPDWTGHACTCRQGIESCVGTNEKVCSGHGNCQCGQCACEANYYGQFCDECATCPTKCNEYRACVQCQAFGTGELKDNCTSCNFKIEKVPEVAVMIKHERQCLFMDENDCRFEFIYSSYSGKYSKIRVKENLDCGTPYSGKGELNLGGNIIISLIQSISASFSSFSQLFKRKQ